MELVLGGGNKHTKRIYLHSEGPSYKNLQVVDIDPCCNPDTLWDLNKLPWPFGDSIYEEVHAYDILEHLGTQGDWRFFFDVFSEIHRILQPNGKVFITVPDASCPSAFSDPGHTRFFTLTTFAFLSQDEYKSQVGKTAMTDYRHYWTKDFVKLYEQVENETIHLILQKK